MRKHKQKRQDNDLDENEENDSDMYDEELYKEEHKEKSLEDSEKVLNIKNLMLEYCVSNNLKLCEKLSAELFVEFTDWAISNQ